ncbi:MAG: hypothetical protein ACREM3_24370 [Candidatus Rokuibacteriota bacterium]
MVAQRLALIAAMILACTVTSAHASGDAAKSFQIVVDSVRASCLEPGKSGNHWQVKGSGKGEAKVPIKVFVVGLGADVEFTREEWDGVQRVLKEDQAKDNARYRDCVEKLTPLFLQKIPDPAKRSQRGTPDILGKWVYAAGGVYSEISEEQVNFAANKYYWMVRPGANATYRIDLYSLLPHRKVGVGTAQVRDDVVHFTLNWNDHELWFGSEGRRYLKKYVPAAGLNGSLAFDGKRLVGHTDAELHRILFSP